MSSPASSNDPHAAQPVRTAGAPLQKARAAMVLLHGRGASASSILSLAEVLAQPEVAYLAPQAHGHTWYPYSFLAPMERNEPGLSSGLRAIGSVLDRLSEAGMAPEQTMVLGFSQGACLALEYTARHAQRYGGVIGLSGGLIGPQGTPRAYEGTLDGTPVFLGCSDVDPHIPLERVHETADVLQALGGTVDKRIYPGMGHTINEDELKAVRGLISRLLDNVSPA